MSQTEFHKGKITYLGKVETTEDLKKYIEDFSINHFDDNKLESFLEDNYYNKYKYKNSHLFKIDDEEFDSDEGGSTKISPTEVVYNISFYNGGTCLEEFIDEYIEEHFKL